MFFLASNGYRVIAHDRRGHGRSDQPWEGNDMDTYTDDLLVLFGLLNCFFLLRVHNNCDCEADRRGRAS